MAQMAAACKPCPVMIRLPRSLAVTSVASGKPDLFLDGLMKEQT
ncbi:hypothetical protein [Parabacteroides faecalis]|nr:hypothetical protein [Parabacteroides faecalis]